MKKKIKSRKLKLTKETVRKLNDGELKQVAGGVTGGGFCVVRTVLGCECIQTSAGPSHPIYC